MPYNEFAYTVLTASGSTLENPPAAYYKVLREPEAAMENTTQLFLAVRFNCNKCHDHPFERWTQDQYYQMAAYFAQVGLKDDPAFADRKIGGTAVEGAKALVEVVYDKSAGDVTHARTGVVTPPKFPYQQELATNAHTRREQLARWLTSPDNQYFSKSYVNRIWSYLLGVGIIEPVDDIRAGNPATNPELLDWLTREFIASGFDTQHVFRTICKSRTYQHALETNKWNDDDQINYSHAIARRLPAETLYDAVHVATGAAEKLPGVPAGFLAKQLPDSAAKLPDDFLGLFGKPPRESACECERSDGVILGQALNLVNGPTLAEAIVDPNNRITKLVAEEKDNRKVVEGLFLAILCRQPSEEEITTALEAFTGFEEERAELAARLAAYEKEVLPKRFEQWLASARGEVQWTVLEPTSLKSSGDATLTKQPDGSVLVAGAEADTDTYTIAAEPLIGPITAIRLEVLPDANLPAQGPGRARNGNFVLSEVQLKAGAKGAELVGVALANATSSFSQDNYGVPAAIDGNAADRMGWAVSPQFGKAHTAVFETREDAGAAAGTALELSLVQQWGSQHTIGRFRVSVTTATRPVRVGEKSALPAEVAKILDIPAGQRTAEQQAALAAHYRTLDAELAALTKAIADHAASASQSRLRGAQDLAWALLNTPAFLFNR
jgi:hypothetical protein